MLLAEGHTIKETAERIGVATRSIDRWKCDSEFAQEIDRLSLMIGIAGRAERVRLAKRVVRQKMMQDKKGNEILLTKADLLEWLKYVQSETDGVQLGLANLIAALAADDAPVAPGGPAGAGAAKGNPNDKTD